MTDTAIGVDISKDRLDVFDRRACAIGILDRAPPVFGSVIAMADKEDGQFRLDGLLKQESRAGARKIRQRTG